LYTYELRSVNLRNLPEKDAAAVLDRFASLLDSLTDPVSFLMVSDSKVVLTLGEGSFLRYSTPCKRFFVTYPVKLDSLLERGSYTPAASIPVLRIKKSEPTYSIDEESGIVRAYSVTRLGGRIQAGFLSDVCSVAHSVRLDISPIETYRAESIVRDKLRSVSVSIGIRQIEGRAADQRDLLEYERVRYAHDSVVSGKERLFRLRMLIVLREKDIDALHEAEKRLRRALGQCVGEIDSPRWLQEPLLTGEGPSWATGRWFYVTTSTAANFIPYSGLDVLDPNGVFLGQNLQTGNAVIYDLFEKENYNMAVLGTTGFGKSTFIKSFMARSALQDKGMMLYVFDSIVKPEYAVGPDGSYERSFAGVTGCTVRRLGNGDDGDDDSVNDTTEKEQGDGLDPLKVLPTKRMAADFLSSIAGIRENEQLLLSQLYRAAELSSSVDQLLQQQAGQGELRTRLEANLQPYMRLFRGEPRFTERMVFILDLPTRQVRDAAAFLALSAVWKMIKEQPVRRRKAVVIDEGWALVEKDPATGKPYFPLAVSYVPEIARTGRHFNTCFVIATQMVTDLLGRAGEYGPGRDMIESCSTKVVLKQDQASSAMLREAFNLSDAEESFVLNADIGTGMLLTTEGHVPFHVFLNQFEKDIFTTRPDQVE